MCASQRMPFAVVSGDTDFIGPVNTVREDYGKMRGFRTVFANVVRNLRFGTACRTRCAS